MEDLKFTDAQFSIVKTFHSLPLFCCLIEVDICAVGNVPYADET